MEPNFTKYYTKSSLRSNEKYQWIMKFQRMELTLQIWLKHWSKVVHSLMDAKP